MVLGQAAVTNERVTKRNAIKSSSSKAKDPASRTPAKLADDEKAMRKRAQNRISQRCLREKQSAKGHNLSSFLEILRSSSKTGYGHNQLLDAYVNLLAENEKMKEALLRMRKRLLSVSNSTALAADDSVFEALLNSRTRTRKPPVQLTSRSRSSSSSSIAIAPKTVPQPANTETLTEPHGDLQGIIVPSLEAESAAIEEEAMFWDNSSAASETGIVHNIQTHAPLDEPDAWRLWDWPNADVHSKNHHANNISDGLSCGDNLPQIPNNLLGTRWGANLANIVSLDSYNIGAGLSSPLGSNQHLEVNRSPAPIHVAKIKPTVFCKRVEAACVMHICRLLKIPVNFGVDKVQSDLNGLKQEYCGRVDDNLVADLADVAVGLLGCHANLDAYIYGVGATVPMEMIMRWRIAPSPATRNAIPEPFTPTPLQYMNCNHSLMIDCVNWPTLRDQLILYSNTTNLDQVIADIVCNTVIDIPQMQVSLNIFDLFANKVLPKINTQSPVIGGPCTLLTIPNQLSEGLLAELISQEIMSRMTLIGRSDYQQRYVGSPSCVRPPRNLKHELSVRLGLDQLTNWKLSQDFCKKYPFLDCSSIAASFPMRPSAALLA